MKRFISLVCGSLVLLLMFLSPGNAVQAEEQDDCGCPGTVFTGAERNKLVAELLKSDVFKEAKLVLKEEGYVWQGAGAIEVRDFTNLTSSELLFMLGFSESHELYEELKNMDVAGILKTLEIPAIPSLAYKVVFLDETGTSQAAGFTITNGQLEYGGMPPEEGNQHE
jgi:hypothetical protein